METEKPFPEENPTPESLYRDFAVPVSRLCRRMIRDARTAEDAAQDIWVELIRALPGFQGRSKLSTWVWTIARRVTLRRAAREKRYSTRFLREFFAMKEHDGLDEMDRIPVEDRSGWLRLQCSECLTGIMHCLSNEDRFVYLLRRLSNLSYAEIAAVTDTTEESARQIYSRSNKKISRFLSGECTLYNPEGSCRCKMREPMLEIDHAGEYRSVREFSRRAVFLDAADRWYGEAPNFWSNISGSLPS